MDLVLNKDLVLDYITESAPQFFPVTMASQNITTVDTDCQSILPACVSSQLNPFPVGVNVTMEYGQYLDVSPDALTSFYTNSFLEEMSQCTLTGICSEEAPEGLQVSSCYLLPAHFIEPLLDSSSWVLRADLVLHTYLNVLHAGGMQHLLLQRNQ